MVGVKCATNARKETKCQHILHIQYILYTYISILSIVTGPLRNNSQKVAPILVIRYTGAVARSKEIALLLSVLLIGAFFRFYLITEIPPGLYPDEAANGNNAVEALRTGSFKVFYPENNGREGLFINLQAVAIRFLGAEPWVLRVVSAVFGTLTVLGIYLLAKELFQGLGSRIRNHESRSTNAHDSKLMIHNSTPIALLSSFFLAVSYWHINFSRIGFRAIMLPFLAVFGMYWLSKALRTGKISSALAAGIAAGLGFSTYIGFRFMPFALAAPLAYALVRWVRSHHEPSVSIVYTTDTDGVPATSVGRPRDAAAAPCIPCVTALFLFAALVVALPLGLHFLQHPADFFGRSGQVSIFSAQSPLREFARSNMLTLGMLNIRGDCNPRHNLVLGRPAGLALGRSGAGLACQPELFWPVGILFLVGLALTVRSLFRRPLSPMPYTLVAWLLFMMLPATLTREGLAHALRAIGMLPPVMLMAGMGGAALWQSISRYFERASAETKYAAHHSRLARIRKELVIAGVLFLLWLPVHTYRDYFIRFAYSPATADAFANDLWETGRYIAKLPDDTQKFVIVNIPGEDIRGVPTPGQTVMFATDTFDAARQQAKRLTYVRRVEDIRIDPAGSGIDTGAKIAIIPLNPKDRSTIAALRQQFPFLEPKVIGGVVAFERAEGR